MKNNNQDGFTLIELVMVLAIISVLSALGLTTYRRATFRAKNVQKIVNLKEAAKAINAYVIENGTLPADLEATRNGGSTFVACLGKTTSDRDGDGLTDCDVTTAPYEESTTLNNDIRTVMNALPTVDNTGVNFGVSGTFWGGTLVYFNSSSAATVNGTTRQLWLNYALLGPSQQCESFGGEVVTGGTPPAWTASGSTTGLQVNGNTICYVALTQEFGR